MVGNSLKRISLEDVPSPEVRLVDPGVDKIAGEIVDDVRKRGEVALREWAERFGERRSGEPLLLGRDALKEAWGRMDAGTACLLERAHGRIAAFAAAQRTCLANLDMPVPGGRAGHEFVPVGRAGCYVPGGRYPLPSSALMTVSAAAAAGVPEIWCAGPHPSDCSLAAAYIAGAEGFLACGGAQAVAALGFGVIVPRCDTVVGPGGKYAASAKRQLFGIVGTEAPAGPSELLIIAGDNADPRLASADLLAQAEHDSAATPMLICQSEIFADALDRALAAGLASLPENNAATASAALANGWMLVESDFDRQCRAAERSAPEHLELMVDEPEIYARKIKSAGAIFLGSGSAEVMGDYGAGPNHTLPTGGAARFASGLSVIHFLRARTWLKLDEPEKLAGETAAFARLEGLEAHARAAELRS